MKILINCMQGIGDSIYSRYFIKLLSKTNEIYLDTVLPDLYLDLNVNFIKPDSRYRTQTKSLIESNVIFSNETKFDKIINFHYGPQDLKKFNILTSMEVKFGFDPGSTKLKMSLPSDLIHHNIELPGNKKIAIVRPVTHRNEWLCTSRSPKPNYIAWCAKILKDSGYYVISIADCEQDKEWIEGIEPPADLKLHKGELGILGTLSLINNSDIIIGGSGFIVPAALATEKNLFIIFGGRGEYDNPHKILDIRLNLKKVGWALPNNFCRCNKMNHDCDKTINDLDDKFFNFIKDIQ